MMPLSSRDWLPEGHLAWFVLASVGELDLSAFYASYRQDGFGRAAHDPAMMVALLLYAYCKGQRSSRGIERECVEDVAYRVVTANQRPDHTKWSLQEPQGGPPGGQLPASRPRDRRRLPRYRRAQRALRNSHGAKR